MLIAIACDHAGFPLKETVMDVLRRAGCDILDLGTDSDRPVDYPDYAEKAGYAILDGKAQRAVILCGSGVGAAIAANKIPGIYAGVCHDTYSARQAVEHDDMNVLCLGARVVGAEVAKEIVTAFLSARFVGQDAGQERHQRRVAKIRKLEGKS
ncbi:MAG: ribose 5-phosphate isomerase B [Chloroflexi bacterium]|nr:ribose 5-phosphate isomerase B [Chloroflexota bacterium]